MESPSCQIFKTLYGDGFLLRCDVCCDIGQIDRLFIIELFPFIVLSSDNTNCKNDIQLFHQLFDELSVYRDYH